MTDESEKYVRKPSWSSLTNNLALAWSAWRKVDRVIPVQARTGPEGFRTMRFPEFIDTRHTNVTEESAIRTGRLYSPRRYTWYSFVLEAVLTSLPLKKTRETSAMVFSCPGRDFNGGPSNKNRKRSDLSVLKNFKTGSVSHEVCYFPSIRDFIYHQR